MLKCVLSQFPAAHAHLESVGPVPSVMQNYNIYVNLFIPINYVKLHLLIKTLFINLIEHC